LANQEEQKIDYLDEVFGARVIIPLAKLLPNTSELEQPPILPLGRLEEYKCYAYAICFFILNHEHVARTIAVEEIVKLVEKLAPFLLYPEDKSLYEIVMHSIY